MTGFFPIMMFGLPAAGLAMITTSKKEHRKLVTGGVICVASTSFLTGITEPIEFLFMFLSPVLYLVNSVFTGLSLVITNLLGIKNGFTFSAGAVDFIDNLTNNVGEKPLLLLLVDLAFGALYYFTFRFIIIKFNIFQQILEKLLMVYLS